MYIGTIQQEEYSMQVERDCQMIRQKCYGDLWAKCGRALEICKVRHVGRNITYSYTTRNCIMVAMLWNHHMRKE